MPRFLYVFAGNRGEPIFQIFHDERPSKMMLRPIAPVIASYQLRPEEEVLSLGELAERYRSGLLDQTLRSA